MPPWVFREQLRVDCDGITRNFGDVMDSWQRRDFACMDDAWCKICDLPHGDNVVSCGFFERPRSHSKTTDCAAQVCFALLSAKRPLRGVVAAVSENQSKLLIDFIATLKRLNPRLMRDLQIKNKEVENRANGAKLRALSSDVDSSWGLLCDFVVCDELCHWDKRQLWTSLLSTAAKRASCVMVVISNAGASRGSGWQWEAREHCRESDAWHFSRLDGPAASWISKQTLEEQKQSQPDSVYRRVWLNQWITSSGEGFAEDDIAGVITLKHKPKIESGWQFFMGADLAFVSDDCALCVVGVHVGENRTIWKSNRIENRVMRMAADAGLFPHNNQTAEVIRVEGTGQFRVFEVDIWRPSPGNRVNAESVRMRIMELNRKYKLRDIAFDPSQAEVLAQQLHRDGLRVSLVPQSGQKQELQSSHLHTLVRNRRLELWPEKSLVDDLRACTIEHSRNGYRFTVPRGSKGGTKHGDSLSALSIACYAANTAIRSQPRTLPQSRWDRLVATMGGCDSNGELIPPEPLRHWADTI